MTALAKSELQYAGEYLLEECSIVATSGKVYNISDLIEEINIHENIFSAQVTGNIIISDTTNIIMNTPIIGEERLLLRLMTPQKNPDPDSVIDFMNSPLMIYKINRQQGLGETSNLFSLQFGSIEGFRNQTSRVTQSYKGQTSDIVEKILRDELYLRSKKRFFKEGTSNLAKVIFPNVRPFKCINHLTNISNSASKNGSPSYMFYETTKGFHLRTFDGLCDDDIVMTFRENVASRLTPQGTNDVLATLETLINYEVIPNKDTINNLTNGMLSSKLITHDVYNKKLNTHKYNYLENFDKDIHPDNGESKPIISEAIDPETRKTLSEHEDTKLYVSSTSSGYSFSETDGNYPYQSDNLDQTLQRRVGRRNQFGGGTVMNIEIHGQTMIKVGDKIRIEIGATSTLSDAEEDDNLTGNYIIMKLRHIFTQSKELKHKIVMQIAKDSKAGKSYPSMGITQQGTEMGNAETIEV